MEHAPYGAASGNTTMPRNETVRLLLCRDSRAFVRWETVAGVLYCWEKSLEKPTASILGAVFSYTITKVLAIK